MLMVHLLHHLVYVDREALLPGLPVVLVPLLLGLGDRLLGPLLGSWSGLGWLKYPDSLKPNDQQQKRLNPP